MKKVEDDVLFIIYSQRLNKLLLEPVAAKKT